MIEAAYQILDSLAWLNGLGIFREDFAESIFIKQNSNMNKGHSTLQVIQQWKICFSFTENKKFLNSQWI